MEDTEWDAYGTGNYEKCADCMVHSGFEASAVMDAVTCPWKAAKLALAGSRPKDRWRPTSRSIGQRPAEYVFSSHVQQKLAEIAEAEARPEKVVAAE